MDEQALHTIRQSYDRVADEYARRMFSELDNKPLDRELLNRLVVAVNGKGEICDIGCGPGHIARYLRDHGADVFGLDLSPGMLDEARRLSPEIPFRQGNMLALDLPDASLAGISAFYAIVHLPPGAVPQAFREMARVLKPGGLLLLSFHIGEETVHRDEWLDRPVTLDFRFFSPHAIQSDLEAAGLVIQEIIEREPYAPEVEHQSRRAYILARKP
ncbi:MAG: class I SAM-dependent methyltransferase [Acidobacteriaceae bacterium]